MKDGEVFGGKRLTRKRVGVAILDASGEGSRRPMSLQFGQGRIVVGRHLVFVHMGKIRVVSGVSDRLVYLLAFRA